MIKIVLRVLSIAYIVVNKIIPRSVKISSINCIILSWVRLLTPNINKLQIKISRNQDKALKG